MVSGFALPLYLVISFIGMVALSLMLPHPFYVPGVKLVRVPRQWMSMTCCLACCIP